MTRIILFLIGLCAVGFAAPVAAQRAAHAQSAPPSQVATGPLVATGLSAEQARIALEVLNDPRKRAAFAATLEAIVKAGPVSQSPATPAAGTAGPGGTGPNGTASAPPLRPSASPVPGTSPGTGPGPGGDPLAGRDEAGDIPLSADSLGAQVLITASDFVHRLGIQVTETFQAVQSLPLLWGWAVVMVTHPVARDILADASWRLLVALLAALAVEYVLRRAMRRPIARLESMAPTAPAVAEELDLSVSDQEGISPETEAAVSDEALVSPTTTDDELPAPARSGRPVVATPLARAEAGEVEPPVVVRRHASPWLLLRRVPLVLARLMLELVPVLGVTLTAHLIAGSTLGGPMTSRLIILAVVDSYAICAAVLCLSRMMLSPGASRLRLFEVPNSLAVYLTRWIRRLAVIAVFGYVFGEVGLLLGLSNVSHVAVQKAIALILHLCLAIMVVQTRRAVRRRIRAPEGVTGVVATLRNRLARSWHWIALFVLAGSWVTLAVEVRHGYTQTLHYILLTALVLIASRLIQLLLLGLIERAVRSNGEATGGIPGLEARLRVYQPALTTILRIAIYLVTALVLLQLYGLEALGWFVSSFLGLRILSALGTFAVTLILAFGVWEAVNAGIQHHLAKLQRDAQLTKSARIRTLLPLLRTTLMAVIATVTALMVLSEIGVNIAPLLAGAGILGVAIGFGSQKLVQDLITGIFLLLENAMQVGDSVTVSGLSGVVEALSVRTIRLRAADGSVHIIPFSAVTSVTNVNRGLGNASVTVTVEFNEDTDQVTEALRQISREMRADPDFSAKMLGDVVIWGVDKFDGAAVTIAGQVVCTDSGRWSVQREFNRRIKKRFQELGIRIFNPLSSYTVAEPALLPDVKKGDGEHGPADGGPADAGSAGGRAPSGRAPSGGASVGESTSGGRPSGGRSGVADLGGGQPDARAVG